MLLGGTSASLTSALAPEAILLVYLLGAGILFLKTVWFNPVSYR